MSLLCNSCVCVRVVLLLKRAEHFERQRHGKGLSDSLFPCLSLLMLHCLAPEEICPVPSPGRVPITPSPSYASVPVWLFGSAIELSSNQGLVSVLDTRFVL